MLSPKENLKDLVRIDGAGSPLKFVSRYDIISLRWENK